MNLLKELKYNVDALEHVVQYHSNFLLRYQLMLNV